MDLVFERLAVLQSRLAAIDPALRPDAADEVAAIASALRNVLAAVDDATRRPLPAAPRQCCPTLV